MQGSRDPESAHLSQGAQGLPVAPSLQPTLESAQIPPEASAIGWRVVLLSGVCIALGIAAGFIAEALLRLIWLITNLAFHGRLSAGEAIPTTAVLGLWTAVVPMGGALVIGFMARYGSSAIRGHGIPEVMERVLYGRSRIPPRIMFLKPLSAAVAIGTGGPFGAEGPIIATGGAFGSFIGQLIQTTATERKTLLAAGAAAGMAATFGTPVAAVLLAVELLLFEYRPRSIIPVALAASAATAVRFALIGPEPAFHMPEPLPLTGAALAAYIVLGSAFGFISVGVSRAIYWIEDAFERLPIHWMWWPALGAVVVGVVGYFEPRTLGVGYYIIDGILQGQLIGWALAALILLKFTSWSIYLGSGTSGGTLAPLFIIGGGIGALLGNLVAVAAPGIGVDPHVAALVGMAAIFAGASHAFLASVVFAFETTQQPMGLLPLLAGCGGAYLVALRLARTSIMTEKLVRRGTPVSTEYDVDYLSRVSVREAASRNLVTLHAQEPLQAVQDWLASAGSGTSHQGFPVVDEQGILVGVVTRRDLLTPQPGSKRVGEAVKRPPVVIYEDNSLRDAADRMVRERVGRLVVVERGAPGRPAGILTRSDLLSAHEPRLAEHHDRERTLTLSRTPPGAGRD